MYKIQLTILILVIFSLKIYAQLSTRLQIQICQPSMKLNDFRSSYRQTDTTLDEIFKKNLVAEDILYYLDSQNTDIDWSSGI